MSMLVKAMKKNAVIIHKPSGMIAVQTEMTLEQRKFYNAFIYVAKQELKKNKDTKVFRCALTDLKAMLDKAKQNNTYYIDLIFDLQERKAYFDILRKDIRVRGKMNVLSYAGVIERRSKKEEVWIEFEFPERIRKALIDMKGMYAELNLIIEKGFRSKYTLVLYENLRDYKNVEFPKIELETFKKLLGVEKGEYKRFFDLKRRVIDVAVEELNENENIDFLVSYELYKTGRKYTHIKFFIKPKPQQLKLAQQTEDYKSLAEDKDLRELLFLLPEQYRKRKNCINLLLGVLEEKGKEYIKAQIDYTSKKNPKNYCGYLKNAIEKDYAGVEEIELEFDEEEDWKKEVIGKVVRNAKTGERWKIAHIGEKDEEGYYEVRLDKIDDPDTVRWFKWTDEKIRNLIKR
ncbi:replication initiation protein [Hippea alviniae]|uniref:replication initiation protein n=1 Tax=Hippea alviniae TaxID=1279027 RepID=UPI00047A4F9E|nr:replication initiation protein [Hippea alviniae]